MDCGKPEPTSNLPMSALPYDPTVLRLAAGTFGFLTTASGVGYLLDRRTVDAG